MPQGWAGRDATTFWRNTTCAPPASRWFGSTPTATSAPQDVARLDAEPGQTVYCYLRGVQFVLTYRLQLWMQNRSERPDQAAVAAKLEELAGAGGVGLTPHRVAVEQPSPRLSTTAICGTPTLRRRVSAIPASDTPIISKLGRWRCWKH